MVTKILVVDDNPDVLLSVMEGLNEFQGKYYVISAKSGEQCLSLLKNNQRPDLILLDIMMPGISGWETFDRIKENEQWKHIPIVFLTARTDKVAKNTGQFLALDYIEKPFSIDELERRIAKILEKRSP